MRNVRNVTCALVVLLLAGVLAACGGGDSSGTSEAVDRGGAAAPAAPSRAENGTAGSTGRQGTAKGARAPLPTGREVVHSARLRVRAGDVEDAAAKAKQMAESAGGYVEQESSSSEPPHSQITLKVPADRYSDVLNRLGTQLGTRISLSQEAEDVTGEVADVDARVRSAKAALESFRKLLGRANSVGEVIQVEQEIAQREADLEALQARLNTLKHRTQYATVTLTLVTKATAPKKDDDERGGFVGGLQNGWDAFVAFVGGLALVLGWLLPFLLAAAVIGVPLYLLRHRLRARFGGLFGGRRQPVPPAVPAPQPAPERAAAAPGASQQPPPPPA
ncbi:DUF4349 domain-containing protein [Actinomadura geliboluensis]|uniref:DUF4349 domain-containing protein n=1 Tax=Actinomadura geliboluensis TaxID=882440 RepID=UPI00371E692A